MFGIGGTELVIILVFGFLIFGPDKLPSMGRTIGRALRQFRQAQEQMNKMVQTEIYDPLNAAAKEPEKKQGPKKKTTAGTTAKPETFAEKKARLAAEASAQAERKLAPAAGEAPAETVVVPEKPVGRSETFAEKKARMEAEKKAAEAKEKAEQAAPKPAIKTRSTSGSKKTGPSKAAKLYSLDGAAAKPAAPAPKPAAAAPKAGAEKAAPAAAQDDTTIGKGDQADA